MRTTLTLDEDVAAKLQTESRRTGKTFREVVNEMLRRGLAVRSAATELEPFRVVARDLGDVLPGLSLDNVSELLDQIEGPTHR